MLDLAENTVTEKLRAPRLWLCAPPRPIILYVPFGFAVQRKVLQYWHCVVTPAAAGSSADGTTDGRDGRGDATDDAERETDDVDRTRAEDAMRMNAGRWTRRSRHGPPRGSARRPRVAARQNTEIVSEPSARDAARCAFSRRFSVAWLGYLAARY